MEMLQNYDFWRSVNEWNDWVRASFEVEKFYVTFHFKCSLIGHKIYLHKKLNLQIVSTEIL